MLKTTLRKLRDKDACEKRYVHLVKNLGANYGDDIPITLLQILDINGLDDALWAVWACDDYEQFARLLACEFAEHVLPIFEQEHPQDTRPRKAIEAARIYAYGGYSDKTRAAAGAAAGAATWAATEDAAWAAARAAAWAAARAATGDAAGAAARAAARAAAWAAAGAAAGAATWAAERKWQEDKLRELLGC